MFSQIQAEPQTWGIVIFNDQYFYRLILFHINSFEIEFHCFYSLKSDRSPSVVLLDSAYDEFQNPLENFAVSLFRS